LKKGRKKEASHADMIDLSPKQNRERTGCSKEEAMDVYKRHSYTESPNGMAKPGR